MKSIELFNRSFNNIMFLDLEWNQHGYCVQKSDEVLEIGITILKNQRKELRWISLSKTDISTCLWCY